MWNESAVGWMPDSTRGRPDAACVLIGARSCHPGAAAGAGGRSPSPVQSAADARPSTRRDPNTAAPAAPRQQRRPLSPRTAQRPERRARRTGTHPPTFATAATWATTRCRPQWRSRAAGHDRAKRPSRPAPRSAPSVDRTQLTGQSGEVVTGRQPEPDDATTTSRTATIARHTARAQSRVDDQLGGGDGAAADRQPEQTGHRAVGELPTGQPADTDAEGQQRRRRGDLRGHRATPASPRSPRSDPVLATISASRNGGGDHVSRPARPPRRHQDPVAHSTRADRALRASTAIAASMSVLIGRPPSRSSAFVHEGEEGPLDVDAGRVEVCRPSVRRR